ncbi:MAG: IctB family putative bicarbonate transporter [Cyanobacteria bacterium P01_F01_bin.33]
MNLLSTIALWDVAIEHWWQQSWFGRWSASLQVWGQSSWLVRCLDPLSLAIAAVYFALSSQPATGPLGLLLLGGAVLVGLQWLTRPSLVTPVHLPLLAYWAIATASTALSPVRQLALEGWIKLTLYLLGFLLLHRLLQRSRWRSILVVVLLLATLVESVHGLRQFIYGAEELATWVDPESGLTGTTRVYSYLLNPNLLAGYLVPAVPIGLAAAWTWSGWGAKAFAVCATGMNVACLALTFSRGGWIGVMAALVAMTLLLVQWNQIYLPPRWRRWALPALVGSGAIAIVLAVAFVEPIRLRVFSIFAGRSDSSNNFRINVWLAVIDMIWAFPRIGIGPGNDAFNRVYPLFQQPNYNALGAYSVPLELMVETGLIGFVVYLWFVLVWVVHGLRTWLTLWQARHPNALWVAGGLAAIAGMTVHGLVDTVWYRPQIQMLWWFAIALVTSNWQLATTLRAQQASHAKSWS